MGALLLRDAGADCSYGLFATSNNTHNHNHHKMDNSLLLLPTSSTLKTSKMHLDIDTPPPTPRLNYSPPPSPAPSFSFEPFSSFEACHGPAGLRLPLSITLPTLSLSASASSSRCPSLSLSPPSPALSLAPPSPSCTDASSAATTFHRFMDLPTELRLKIWRFSFVPRVVEVHRRKSHYADMNTPHYQSWSANPAALSVSYEARTAALRHYTASIRLAVNTPCDLAGAVRLDSHRRLYIAPTADTLAMLGDFDVSQTVHLLNILRCADRRSFAKIKLAICASSISEASLLLIYGRTIFHDIEQLTLFLYKQRGPPAAWKDGQCALVDCRGTYQYRRFLAKQAAELRVRQNQITGEDEWITVGQRPLQVRELVFGEGATMQDEAASSESHAQKMNTAWSAAFGTAPPTPPMDSFFRYW